MAYREAGAQVALTDGGSVPSMPAPQLMSLVTEMRMLAGSIREIAPRHEAIMELIKRRKDEATMTLVLTLADDWEVSMLNDALLGMRMDTNTQVPVVGAARPVHRSIKLQSLKRHCRRCDSKESPCGRKGKYHDIVYKTATRSGTFADHKELRMMGGQREETERCEVDPETGLFELEPLEAKKCLRQFGEHIGHRWVDRKAKKGDRWLVREVLHHRQYVENRPAFVAKDEPITTAD